ncbi:hypothetical protein [Zhaonella formicivorans]|uniref:hypothetical protein n=1 Tax=Zhaonella formicivorans TaxID=2528593 RepID=UPI0010E2C2B2|nr:hypothetical protein [Zhaonella formicivorans]
MILKINNKPLKQASKSSEGLGNTVQNWLPFRDLEDYLISTKDNRLIAVLRVMPLNINLKSDNEKGRIISAVHEAFNGLQFPIQIFAVPRPIDLDMYIRKLQELSSDAGNFKRKTLLLDYIRYVTGMVAGGEALEKRYYILLSAEKGKNSKAELLQKAHELGSGLSRAGLAVSVCDGQEIFDLMFTFHNPVQVAFEKAHEIGINTYVTYYGD